VSEHLPRVFDSGQLSLFPTEPHELCRKIGLSWWAAIQLHKEGFISFDPEDTPELNEPQMAELTFVGSFVAADCPPRLLEELLSGLTPPFCYSHSRIYYCWLSRTWKPIPEPADASDEYRPSLTWRLIPKFPENPGAWDLFHTLSRQPGEYAAAFQWLDRLAELDDEETLQDMRHYIDRLLSLVPAGA
jgi:hypothetical protein